MRQRSIRREKELLRHRLAAFQIKIAELSRSLAEQEESFRQREDGMLSELFEVLDAFDNLGKAYEEKADTLDKTSKKLLKSMRAIAAKIRRALKARHIEPIVFPDGKARMDLCKIIDTQSVPGKKSEHIIRIEKTGYIDTRRNLVLRKAEVVTVSSGRY
jgi:molecular chaperone GrpE (heat shock protein)